MKTIMVECKACNGTGIFKGRAERGAAGVICNKCKGVGGNEIQYREFTELKKRTDIARVYGDNFGHSITDIDSLLPNGRLVRFSEGGCTYDEWLDGKKPEPIRDLYCPYLCNYKELRDNPLERCAKVCHSFGRITDCDLYKDKATCWEIAEARVKNDEVE